MCRGLESVPLRSDEVVLLQLLVQAQVLKPPRQLCLLEELGFAPELLQLLRKWQRGLWNELSCQTTVLLGKTLTLALNTTDLSPVRHARLSKGTEHFVCVYSQPPGKNRPIPCHRKLEHGDGLS